MALLKNKRGVEALPLRYIIIALVAALVIGIALQFVGILKTTTIGAANQYGAMTNATIICETDKTGPIVSAGWLYNTSDGPGTTINKSAGVMYLSATVTDNQGGCGIDDYNGVFAYIWNSTASVSTPISLTRVSGTDTFKGTYNPSSLSTTVTYHALILAVDNSTTMNVARLTNATNNVTIVS